MWWNSSKDAEKLSLTIRGIFTVGVIALIVLILGVFGVNIDTVDINSLLDSFHEILVAFATLVGLVMTAYGVVRKIYYKIKK